MGGRRLIHRQKRSALLAAHALRERLEQGETLAAEEPKEE